MFPPRQVQTAQELLQGVLSSLARAGLEVTGEVVNDYEDYYFVCHTRPPSEHIRMIARYVKDYCRAAGWEAELKFQLRPSRIFSISLEKTSSRVWKSA